MPSAQVTTGQAALSDTPPLEQQVVVDQAMTEPLALSVGQPTNLGQELPAPHENKPEEDGEDTNREDSSEGSMVDGPSVGSPLAEVVTPVLI